jgi:hypothetical protein
VTLISTYFMPLRVFAVTTAATGTSTGGIIFPAMIQYLIPKIGQSIVVTSTCNADTSIRISVGSAVHGVCCPCHVSSHPRPSASEIATTKVGTAGRVERVQRACVHAFHLWRFPPILDPVFCFLLRTVPIMRGAVYRELSIV